MPAGWGGGFDWSGGAAGARRSSAADAAELGSAGGRGVRGNWVLLPFTARLSAPRDHVKLGKFLFFSPLGWVCFPARFFGAFLRLRPLISAVGGGVVGAAIALSHAVGVLVVGLGRRGLWVDVEYGEGSKGTNGITGRGT